MKSKHDIIWLKEVDSTNNEAKRRLSDIDNLSVLSAISQTAGRGQRGNSWSSIPGENLMFSVVLKYGQNALPPVQAYDQFVISEAAALAVTDLLAAHEIQAQIKWPNDIYAGERKICGILIEHSLCGKWLAGSIVGIGLNVNQRNFDVSLPNPTSMVLSVPSESEQSNTLFPLPALLEEFMDIFTGYLSRYCHIKGGYAKLRHLYLAQLWRLGEPARYIYGSEEFTGTIEGVSDIGHLLVRNEKGELKEFAFKEISYVI